MLFISISYILINRVVESLSSYTKIRFVLCLVIYMIRCASKDLNKTTDNMLEKLDRAQLL